MKHLMIPVLLLAVLTYSCSKDNSSALNANTKSNLNGTDNLTKHLVRIDRVGYADWPIIMSYNDHKLTTMVDSIDGNRTVDSAVYKNGVLSNAYYTDAFGSLIFNYGMEYDTNGKVIKVNLGSEGEQTQKQYDSLVYNTAGKISAIYNVVAWNDGRYELTFLKEFTWDANGNLAEMTGGYFQDGNFQILGKNVFTYDTNPNIFSKMAPAIYWLYFEGFQVAGPNNMIREEYYNLYSGTPQLAHIKTNTYTYDNEGDVLTCVSKATDGEGVENGETAGMIYRYEKW